MKTHTTTLIALLLVLPLALAQSGGGTIQNAAPSITGGLTGSVSSTTNVEAVTETFTFTVKDANGEADIQGVKITSTAAGFGTKECLAPFSCSGWSKVDDAAGDGVLAFTYTHQWPQGQAAGSYTQTASVRDEGSYVAGSTTDATAFSNAPSVQSSASTHGADGSLDGDAWGGWSATPGQTLVQSTNYLQATNTGTSDGVVTVSFSDTAFTSSTSGSIGIDGNIRFRHGTGSTPSAATFQETPVDADGSYTFTVPAGASLWIAYEIMELPSVLPDADDYAATYTFA